MNNEFTINILFICINIPKHKPTNKCPQIKFMLIRADIDKGLTHPLNHSMGFNKKHIIIGTPFIVFSNPTPLNGFFTLFDVLLHLNMWNKVWKIVKQYKDKNVVNTLLIHIIKLTPLIIWGKYAAMATITNNIWIIDFCIRVHTEIEVPLLVRFDRFSPMRIRWAHLLINFFTINIYLNYRKNPGYKPPIIAGINNII